MKRLILLLVCLLYMQALYAEGGWISAYSTGPYLVYDNDADPTVVKLKLGAGVKMSDVAVKLVSVKFDGKIRTAYENGIAYTIDTQKMAIVITGINMKKLPTAGTYEALFVCSCTVKGKDPVDIPISLVHPLSAPASVFPSAKIEIVGTEVRASDPIIIKGLSADFLLRNWSPDQPYFRSANNIVPFDYYEPVKPTKDGRGMEVPYKLNIDFIENIPLGTSYVGTLNIAGDNINPPLQIPIEISRRQPRFMIILMLFAGLLLSFIVKIHLEKMKNKADAVAKVLELVKMMSESVKKIADKKFNDSVNKEVTMLLEEVKKMKGVLYDYNKLLTETIKSSLDVFKQEKIDHETRQKAAKEELEKYTLCFEYITLNDLVSEQMEEVRKNYKQAKSYLEKGEPDEAQVSINRMLALAKGRLKNMSDHLALFIAAIAEGRLVPDAARRDIANRTAAMLNIINADLKEMNSAPGVPDKVIKANDVFGNIADLINLYIKIADDMKIRLIRDIRPPQELMTKLDGQFALWKKELMSFTDDLKDPVMNVLDELNDTWQQIEAIRAPAAAMAAIQLNVERGGAFVVPANTQRPLNVRMPERLALPKVSDIDMEISAARRAWNWAHVIQFILLIAVLGLTSYKIYEKDFIGTVNELIAIFLFAFSADVTIDKVIQLRTATKSA